MAAVAPPADQAADLLKNLSLDQSKTLEGSEPANKPLVDSEVNGNGQSQPVDRSLTPVIPDFMDPAVAYFPSAYPSPGYYYGGYDGATNDYSRLMNPDGVDMSQGVYGENGSLMYPGYGYAPYGPYSPAGSPVPTTSHDGQLYGTQHYQYPSPYFQPVTPPSAPPKGDFTRSAAGGQPSFTVDTTAKENTGAAPVRPVANPNPVFSSNGSYGSGSQNGFQDPVYRFDGAHSPIPWLDSTMYYNGQPRSNTSSVALSNNNGFASKNQNVGSHSHLVSPRPMSAINTASGYMNRAYPNKLYGQYQGAYGSGFGYGSNSYGSQNRQGWLTLDNKYRSRGRGNANGFFNYNNENSDGLNELNRGPRARITKNQKVPTRVTITIKGQNDNLPETVEKDTVCAVPDREQYNQADFPETYTDAKFFIIKSYSEDDVHKSVKYNVWSSTQNGNKKLDAAYHEAQQKPEKCPVFLFFSVNTSGQFVGVAEMVGPVDFNKSLDYWQQDKWVGYFLKLTDTKTSIMNKLLSSFLTLCFLVLVFDTPTSNATGRSMVDGILLPSQKNEQPYRTGYHFQPPSNWMNDPNGPMLYQGVYHFFYQYNPLAPTFGTIVWGHAVSHDLVNWIHLDPAIYPTHEPDISSCWSGSATILPGNLPAMIYTGSDSTSRQVQDLAWPKNRSDPFLREWVKSTHNPIITPPEGVKDDCFRDPSTAWLGPDGLWRIVVGGDRDNNGMAFLYQSPDFVTWTRYENPLAAADSTGTWECPDFFPVQLNSTNGLDTSVVSSGSVLHVMKAGFGGRDWYTIGTYSPDRENFLPQNGLSLSGSTLDLRYDYGNFYASKSFFDESKNRRVLWAWVPEKDSEEDDIEKGWAGLQSFPRALWIDRSGKQLIQWPVEEIETLRGNEVKLKNKRLKSGSVVEIEGVTASQADVTISFKLEDLKEAEVVDTSSADPQALCTDKGASSKGVFGPFGVLAMASKDLKEQTAIFFRVFQNQIGRYSVLMCSDLSRSTIRSTIDKTSFGAFVDIDPQYDEISLRNLIDHSIIESFGAGGKTCITSRVYPQFLNYEDAHLFAFNNGTQSVKISQMSAWSMKNAEFTSDQTVKSAT